MGEWIQNNINKDYARWPLWIPVALGVGISLYFAWPQEPSLRVVGVLLASGFLPLLFLRGEKRWGAFLVWAVLLGFFCGSFRTHFLGTRMLQHERGPLVLQGDVVSVEVIPTKSKNPIQRVVLDHVQTQSPSPLPPKVRLTFRGLEGLLSPGDHVEVLAKLMPMGEPSSPWSYDFRRQAYFQGLGGVGFSLGAPTLTKAKEAPGFRGALNSLRFSMTQEIRAKTPEGAGGVAAALITGDRSGISETTRENFINSGLAHILAISGLHLSIVAGLVFLILRRGLALVPQISLRWNVKKIAAVLAIFVTWFYLGISGFAIPAERAFYMTTLVMVAFLMDRQAISMRSVAIAATILLTTRPEYLISPSFQLSFSAVVGLIAFYESYKNPIGNWLSQGGWWRWTIVYGMGLVLTSLIATLATLPFTILHFNRFTLHAVLANLLAVPLTSFAVMPLALLSTLSLLWGGSEFLFYLYGESIFLLMDIAASIGNLPGADIKIPTPPTLAVALFMAGSLWLIIWHQRWRYGGLLPMAAAVLMAAFESHPNVLVDEKLMALFDESSKTLQVSSTRKGKFTLKQWKGQLGVIEHTKMECMGEKGEGCLVEKAGYKIYLTSQTLEECPQGVDLLISTAPQSCKQPKIDQEILQKNGSHALWLTPILSVQASRAQRRPWTLVYKKDTFTRRKGTRRPSN